MSLEEEGWSDRHDHLHVCTVLVSLCGGGRTVGDGSEVDERPPGQEAVEHVLAARTVPDQAHVQGTQQAVGPPRLQQGGPGAGGKRGR